MVALAVAEYNSHCEQLGMEDTKTKAEKGHASE